MIREEEKEQVHKALVSIKKLLQKGWTKGFYAKTATGRGVKYNSRSATKFCMMGAIYRTTKPIKGSYARWSFEGLVKDALRKHIPRKFYSIPGFNDHESTKKKDVIEIVSKAIEQTKPKKK